jgi:hypothetical protein
MRPHAHAAAGDVVVTTMYKLTVQSPCCASLCSFQTTHTRVTTDASLIRRLRNGSTALRAEADCANFPCAPNPVEKLISDAVAGMDDALLKVVEANKVALSKLSGSPSFDDSTVAKVLRELETLEEQFCDGVKRGTEVANAQIKKQWASVLDKIPRNQTEAGEQVLQTLAAQAKQADNAIKATRKAGLRLAHTLTQNYATLVSGILMGLTEGMKAQKKRG